MQLSKRTIPTWDELEMRGITQEEWNAMDSERQDAILREIDKEDERRNAQVEIERERERKKEEARLLKIEEKARKRDVEKRKKMAILESAFESSDDDGGGGGSDDSDWFEGDIEFDGSDDE